MTPAKVLVRLKQNERNAFAGGDAQRQISLRFSFALSDDADYSNFQAALQRISDEKGQMCNESISSAKKLRGELVLLQIVNSVQRQKIYPGLRAGVDSWSRLPCPKNLGRDTCAR